MKLKQKSGFTLIELLVVVLIIGVLTAVAVPQYRRAVEKTKATQALALLGSVQQAFKVYLLQNGRYPANLNELDITLPAWTGTQKWLNTPWVRSNGDWSLQYGQIQNGMNGFSIGRVSGPYAGAGWVIYTGISITALQNYVGQPLCFETNKYATISFINNGRRYGDYCVKLFGATPVNASNSGQWYRMP